MSYEAWIKKLSSASKSSIISEKLRKIHYTFPDGTQMAEEYSMDTGIILKRAWKQPKQLGGEPEWVLELGDVVRQVNPSLDNILLTESVTEPILTKRLTKNSIEWRIRNLPYALPTYSVTANTDKCAITVRTTNKKYFKVITIPELERCQLLPQQNLITTQHQYNTLIITYQKPKLLLDMEKAVLMELQQVDTETDLDVDCNDLLKQLIG